MKYVIIRDDDTNALTPVSCLEKLYRPFLDRGLPVNLATIPNVNTSAVWADGKEEGFLFAKTEPQPSHRSIASNPELLSYLKANTGYKIVHHGYEHEYLEFARRDSAEIAHRLDEGREHFERAGIEAPKTFVAPYDQLSPEAYVEVAKRFSILSTGWFELKKLPLTWWPAFMMKKLRKQPHWSVGQLQILSHPGCLLSHKRPPESILPLIGQAIANQSITVLVTHWWEYFHGGITNDAYINALHQTAQWLATNDEIRVISFSDLLNLEPSTVTKEQMLSGLTPTLPAL
jgi:hypothetical protein